MRKKINTFLESNSGMGLYFNFFIQFLIIVSIVNFTILTLPNLSTKTQEIINGLEVFCVAVFTIEYLLRIYAAKSRVRFFFSFFGLVRSANGDYGLAAPEAQWNDTVNNQILFDFVPYVRQRSRFLVFKLIFDF